MFWTSLSASNERLPATTETLPVLSIRKSTLPPLASLTAVATSSVTVPVLGLGIKPRGPRMRAHLRTSFIASTVAIATSKSHQPSLVTFSIKSPMPTKSAPAALAASACSPPANTATLTALPEPLGSLTVPRTAVSPLASSLPRWKYTSTVSSNFAPALALTNLTASSIETAFWGAFLSALKYFFPCLIRPPRFPYCEPFRQSSWRPAPDRRC